MRGKERTQKQTGDPSKSVVLEDGFCPCREEGSEQSGGVVLVAENCTTIARQGGVSPESFRPSSLKSKRYNRNASSNVYSGAHRS